MTLEQFRSWMHQRVVVVKHSGASYVGVLSKISPGRGKILLRQCQDANGRWWLGKRSHRWFDPKKIVSISMPKIRT